MVRFRRDVGSLFTFIKASALLHQAQRQVDAQGRVIATIADYALAYPIFTKVMAESSGKSIPANVRAVVKLIAERAGAAATKPTGMRFQRVEVAGHAAEVTISSEQIGTATGIGKSAAYRAVIAAIDLGFLANNETRPGKPFRLVLKHGVNEAGASLLPRSEDDHSGRRCRMTRPVSVCSRSLSKPELQPDKILITLTKLSNRCTGFSVFRRGAAGNFNLSPPAPEF